MSAMLVMCALLGANPELLGSELELELGVFAGALWINQDHEFLRTPSSFDSPTLSLGARVALKRAHAALELEGAFIPSESDLGDAPTRALRGHVVLALEGYRFVPFLVAGGGVVSVKAQENDLPRDIDGAFHWGLGLKLPVHERLAFRVDARHILSRGRVNTNTSHFEALAGVSLSFGGARHELEPVAERSRCAGPEDLDGYLDDDGCADPDNDGDGVPDTVDGAPLLAEDFDGFQDDDGIPDPVNFHRSATERGDEDAATTADAPAPPPAGASASIEDKEETPSGISVATVFPDPDLDEDGILDAYDRCVEQAEDHDGFEDWDGCPDLDNDGDGVPDADDECPDHPDVNCGRNLDVSGKIYFASGSDSILVGRSRRALKSVLAQLEGNSIRLEVRGHTDSRGKPTKNRRLSNKRARAVVRYLRRRGVKRERLSALGLGPDEPIAENDTREGRAQNRRVEFRVLEVEP
ncbi:MAG: OmpA family protein [Myxococcota bacterium]